MSPARKINPSSSPPGEAGSLQAEIDLLRSTIRRVMQAADAEAQDLAAWSETLRTLSAAAGRLAQLVQTQQRLHGAEPGELEQALNAALAGLAEEYRRRQEAAP